MRNLTRNAPSDNAPVGPKKRNRNAEFIGGFAKVPTEAIALVLSLVRSRDVHKNELRLFAAEIEWEEQPAYPARTVTHQVILHQENNRLSNEDFHSAQQNLLSCGVYVHLHGKNESHVRVPRLALRAIASGRLTVFESVILLIYLIRRKPQRRRLSSLPPGQRYARMSYRLVHTIAGCSPSTISRALKGLRAHGFICRVKTRKQNENVFGALLTDGPLIAPKILEKNSSALEVGGAVENDSAKKVELTDPHPLESLPDMSADAETIAPTAKNDSSAAEKRKCSFNKTVELINLYTKTKTPEPKHHNLDSSGSQAHRDVTHIERGNVSDIAEERQRIIEESYRKFPGGRP